MKTMKTLMAAAAMVAMTGTAQAALIDLGDFTVKDTKTNLIWLKDWNVNGKQVWDTQKAWAEGLNFAGSSDWRLPEISEYGALSAAYGDLTLESQFTSVQSDLYWSGTEISATTAWGFRPSNGSQVADFRSLGSYAVAVRPGDVTAVPEPQTLALVLMALGAMVAVRRRRPR